MTLHSITTTSRTTARTRHHSNPSDLRTRAKHHMSNWRQWWTVDPVGAADELERANNLLQLAEEAEQAGVGR